MQRSSNPVLGNLGTQGRQAASQYGAGQSTATMPGGGYQQAGYDMDAYGQGPADGAPAHRPITIDDIVSKTSITLGVIATVGVGAFFLALNNLALMVPLLLVGGIGGFITVLVATFGRKMDSAPVTLIYAAFQGLFIGAISLAFTYGMDDGVGMMIGQAILGTFGVFAGMLYVYKSGAIRVTPKFRRFMIGAIIGVLVLVLFNLFTFMLFGVSPLRDGGPMAIIFSLVVIGIAAFSFLLDFDAADQLVRAGAPSKMAWGVALGLAVTLVWLYVEILRLLSYFRD